MSHSLVLIRTDSNLEVASSELEHRVSLNFPNVWSKPEPREIASCILLVLIQLERK